MPELPEVETVKRGLERAILGKRIRKALIRRADLRVPVPSGFARRVEGKKIVSLARRAKYLLIHLEGGITVLTHLGMSGSLVVRPKAPSRYAPHDHIALVLEDGSTLVYNDPRRFGMMALADTKSLAQHPLLAHLGVEPLEKKFTPEALSHALKKRTGHIKSALMDQSLVVGIGNIYASEILFLAGLRPTRRADRCAACATALVDATRRVLKAAIASGGSTLRDYVRSTGDPGYFQHRFAVYDREGKPCQRCKTPIKRIVQSGRATYFCPSCQR